MVITSVLDLAAELLKVSCDPPDVCFFYRVDPPADFVVAPPTYLAEPCLPRRLQSFKTSDGGKSLNAGSGLLKILREFYPNVEVSSSAALPKQAALPYLSDDISIESFFGLSSIAYAGL